MKSFVEHLSIYAEYHRDSRNIMTHLFGVPIIVFAVILLLSRPQFQWFGLSLSPAMILMPLVMIFYLRLNVFFALVLGALMTGAVLLSQEFAALSTLLWAAIGVGLFVLGWIVQFIGHYYEGKKPAFVDDLTGLLIGPLFVLAEVFFAVGMFKDLQQQIEQRVGKVRGNDKRSTSVQ
ncbi:MAG: DUF962 domain-containing protein [Aestuariibacter sp.]